MENEFVNKKEASGKSDQLKLEITKVEGNLKASNDT